jgi:hypothetical protein
MSDEKPEEKPDPLEDVRKGLGLLFRAAKSTLEQLPTQKFEEAVVSGAREVGRAIENVTGAIDKQFFKRDSGSTADRENSHESESAHEGETPGSEGAKPEPKPSEKEESETRGPRVE